MNQTSPLTEQQLETILKNLPRHQRDEQRERLFYAKLQEMSAKKTAHHRAEPKEAVSWFSFSWRRFSLVGGFALVVLMASTVVLAYQPSVTRTSILYPVKQFGEKIELSFAGTSLEQVDTHLRFSDRRLDEANYMLSDSPSLALFIQTAKADAPATDQGEIDSPQEIALSETLDDMHSEVSQASDILATSNEAAPEVEPRLEKIEKALGHHVEVLNAIQKTHSAKVKKIVNKVIEDQDDKLANVLDAHDRFTTELETQMKKAGANPNQVKVAVTFAHQNAKLRREQHMTQAQAAVTHIVQEYDKLPPTEKNALTESVSNAQEALTEGHFGVARGLSKKVQRHIKELEEKVTKTEEVKNSLEKPVRLRLKSTESTEIKAARSETKADMLHLRRERILESR